MEDAARRLVQHTLGGTGWSVHRPAHGWSSFSFVGARGPHRVFVKFGAPPDILRHLAGLGVAPAVIAAGEWEGTPYVIQEFIDAPYPDHHWIRTHQDHVARLMRTFHGDGSLRVLLAGADRPARQLRDLEVVRATVAGAFSGRPELMSALAWLDAHRPVIPADGQKPTHGDVSPKNFLMGTGRLVMIDWDDIALADPARDLGPLLWWYLPPAEWPEFLGRYGAEPTPELTLRLYWWAACVSLDVTAGLLERGYDDEGVGFLGDFLAAASERPNPRAQYTGLPR